MTETAASAVDLSNNLITENHVKAALRADKGTEANLTSWTIEDFTKKGDNYATRVTSVNITYTTAKSECCSVSYAVKVNPCRNIDDFEDVWRLFFYKEARFYENLATELNKKLTEIGLKPLAIPRGIYSSIEEDKELIFMEDLRAQGFKLFDRKKGLDRPHTTMLLQELARFHAASLLLQDSATPEITRVMDDVLAKEWMNFNENACELISSVLGGDIGNTIRLLEKATGYEKAIEWLKDLQPRVLEAIENQIRKCEPFVVACHGDFWNCNALFRYDDSGSPLEVKLVDFQMVRLASPATDLSYLLHTSLNVSDRKNNLDQYLDAYYHAFRSVLETGKLQVPFSRQELQEEYKDKRLYGVIFAMMIVPGAISDDEHIPDYDDLECGLLETVLDHQAEKLLDMLDKNPLLRSRFLGLFDELFECGFI